MALILKSNRKYNKNIKDGKDAIQAKKINKMSTFIGF